MKRIKKCVILLLTLITTMSFCMSAYAEAKLSPRWNYLILISGDLNISNLGVAKANVTCVADANDIDKLVITAKIQRLEDNWKTVKSWTVTEYSNSTTFDKQTGVYKNYSYRLQVTVKAYSGSTLKETVTQDFDYGYYS